MNRSWGVSMTAVALLVAGCESAPVPGETAVDRPIESEPYRIGVDDRVQVTVWRNPEVSVTAPVRPDGKITVPLIGDVQAGGRTPAEVAENIKKQLSAYIRDANVSVIVTDLLSSQYISRVRIIGAVKAPKSMPYRQGMTVLDVVLEAGGLNDFASANNTKLYRRTKDKTEVIDIELGNILSKGRLETNLYLRPGDVITVPERLF